MKVLVLGAGQIGSAIMKTAAPSRHEAILRTHAQLDIVDPKAVSRVFAEIKPDWVVNAAAYTAVDRAEDEPAAARAVNDTAVATLVDASARENVRVLHLSTDFVFDGKSGQPYRPNDATHPLNVYGATKQAGEQHVLKGGRGIVLRTSWVYAAAGKNFVLTMLKLMKEREQLNVVCDQIGTPTWAMSAAAAVWALIELGPQGGIYHWTDLGRGELVRLRRGDSRRSARARAADACRRHRAHSERRVRGPRRAAQFQRVGYLEHPRIASYTGFALARIFAEDAR